MLGFPDQAANQHMQTWNEVVMRAELDRVRGELLRRGASADPADPERCFRRAVSIASELGCKSWELRTATSLARLWSEQGERQKSYDLLFPTYDGFTEGLDTADLKEAKALLDGL